MDQRGQAEKEREVCPVIAVGYQGQLDRIARKRGFFHKDAQLSSHYQLMGYLSKRSYVTLQRKAGDFIYCKWF